MATLGRDTIRAFSITKDKAYKNLYVHNLKANKSISSKSLNIQGNSELCGNVHVCGDLTVDGVINMKPVTIGANAVNTGTISTAIGVESEATRQGAVSYGWRSKATGITSTAIGTGSQAFDDYSTALGSFTRSSGNGISIGYGAESNNNLALGSSEILINTSNNGTHNTESKELEVVVNGTTYYVKLYTL